MIVTLVDSEMSSWTPDTRHYLAADGTHLAVSVQANLTEQTIQYIEEALAAAELPKLEGGAYAIVASPTTVIECNDEGIALSMTPLHTFPPGTSHEDALAQAGYTS